MGHLEKSALGTGKIVVRAGNVAVNAGKTAVGAGKSGLVTGKVVSSSRAHVVRAARENQFPDQIAVPSAKTILRAVKGILESAKRTVSPISLRISVARVPKVHQIWPLREKCGLKHYFGCAGGGGSGGFPRGGGSPFSVLFSRGGGWLEPASASSGTPFFLRLIISETPAIISRMLIN